MVNPYQVVKDFESTLCEYTGAPYAVTVTSCTAALLLAIKWRINPNSDNYLDYAVFNSNGYVDPIAIEIPSRTYISVPMSIIHAGGRPIFKNYDWLGAYELEPIHVWDCARLFTSNMFNMIGVTLNRDSATINNRYLCCSFHWTKTLAIGQGGVILHNDMEADAWFRRMRFDGRTEGVAPKDDNFREIGYHCYMSPRDAAEGLSRLAILPKHNDPLPNDDYPDLSKLEIFK